MYIQVTTRCNMACAHCLFSCSPRKGRHMTLDTFMKAVRAGQDRDEMFAIGGGEPTLHPDLLPMLGIASMLSDTGNAVFMVTNGTCPERLWRTLMEARARKSLDIHVSRSPWHDRSKLRSWVGRDADKLGLWWGDLHRGAHRVVVMRGRAKRNRARIERDCRRLGLEARFPEVDCSEARVSPDGGVWADVPGGGRMGHINDIGSLDRAYEAIQMYEEKDWERSRT